MLVLAAIATAAGHDLGVALCGDIACGMVAASAAAPFIATIDQAVVTAAAANQPVRVALASTLKTGLLRNPLAFSMSFQARWIIAVYGTTYATSNAVDSACAFYKRRSELPKLVGTTTLNSGMSLAKDAAFAKAFGTQTARTVPPASFALFLLRDVLTMGCAFVLPAPLAALTGRPPAQAQLLCPVVAQIFTVAPHLLALDIYNRPGVHLKSRIAVIGKRARGTWGLRTVRAVPSLGAGVIANNKLRAAWRSRFRLDDRIQARHLSLS